MLLCIAYISIIEQYAIKDLLPWLSKQFLLSPFVNEYYTNF